MRYEEALAPGRTPQRLRRIAGIPGFTEQKKVNGSLQTFSTVYMERMVGIK